MQKLKLWIKEHQAELLTAGGITAVVVGIVGLLVMNNKEKRYPYSAPLSDEEYELLRQDAIKEINMMLETETDELNKAELEMALEELTS